MSPESPALVATLPARSASEARAELAQAREAGADFAEVRLDRWSAEERALVHLLFPSPLPLVATLRSRAEGGEGPDDPEERAAILTSLAGYPFAFLDVETARDFSARPGSALRSLPARPREIRSTHFPAGTPPAVVLRELEEPVAFDGIRKLVLPLSTGVALTELLPGLTSVPLAPDRLVLTTGGSGPLLRALGKRVGLPLVFATLPRRAGPPSSGAVEEAQLPVDELRRFFAAPGEPPLFAVVGHPVRHSLSPWIHASWIERTGRSGLYLPLDVVTEEEFRAALVRLGPAGFRGVNVTHPWKAGALALAGRASATARECGAANCLTLSAGEIVADNTDVAAVRRRLEEIRSEGKWSGDQLTVLGGGGAARATLAAARMLRARATVVTHRRSGHRGGRRIVRCQRGDPKHPVTAPLVVQATARPRRPSPARTPAAAADRPGGLRPRLGLRGHRRLGRAGGTAGRGGVRGRRATPGLPGGRQLRGLVGRGAAGRRPSPPCSGRWDARPRSLLRGHLGRQRAADRDRVRRRGPSLRGRLARVGGLGDHQSGHRTHGVGDSARGGLAGAGARRRRTGTDLLGPASHRLRDPDGEGSEEFERCLHGNDLFGVPGAGSRGGGPRGCGARRSGRPRRGAERDGGVRRRDRRPPHGVRRDRQSCGPPAPPRSRGPGVDGGRPRSLGRPSAVARPPGAIPTVGPRGVCRRRCRAPRRLGRRDAAEYGVGRAGHGVRVRGAPPPVRPGRALSPAG